MDRTRTIKPKKKGQHAVHFQEGGLHQSLHIAAGEKIPEKMRQAARAGDYGPKAKAQEVFAENFLTGGTKKKKPRK